MIKISKNIDMKNATKTILACDDEPIILEAISYIIVKEGYNLVTAENGIEALNIAREMLPDLMLLDVNMPELTGFEVCEMLKNDDKTKALCIVMLTANVQASDYSRAEKAGANGFIQKPFSPKELKIKILSYLR